MIRAAVLAAILAALAVPADAAPKRSEESRLLDAYLSRKHPDGKGPASTSSGRGWYKGGGGRWYRR